MARSVGFTIDIKPIAGLVTEYTKLAFPEQASIECDNVVFFKNALKEGVSNVSTRPSINLIDSSTSIPIPSSLNYKKTWFEWNNPGELNTEDSILCVQFGEYIYFWEISNTSFLNNVPIGIINLEALKLSGAPYTGDEFCSFAEAKGYLFIAHPYVDPIRVEFNNPGITITQLDIKIRDTSGVDDGLDYTTRPTTLSDAHHYNLLNQGWTDDRINQVFTAHNFYPAHSDIWWMYKDVNDNFNANLLTAPSYPNLNMPAAKGWFILSAFNQDRSTASGVPGLPIISSGYFRPKALAYYAGRIWYGAPDSKEFYGKVYFSQTLENIEQAENCYQVNDPTSEVLSDVLDTDGGVIDLGDSGSIQFLVPYLHGLLVIAEQGVWFISGPTNQSFKPTDFSVTKLSGVSTPERYNVISANGVPFWWNENGIYSIVRNQIGDIGVVSITDETIRSIYTNTTKQERFTQTCAFDKYSQTIIWSYTKTNGTTEQILFNVKEKTFSKWSIAHQFGTVISLENKVLQSTIDGKPPTLFNVYLLWLDGQIIRAATYNDKSVAIDWDKTPTISNAPFKAYFDLGYRIHGALTRRFQNPYVFIYLNNTPNTHMFFTAYWDFYDRDNYPGIAIKQEIRDNPLYSPYTVIKKRLRIRGRGDSVVFRFENNEYTGSVFDFLGFGTKEILEQDV